MEITFVSKISVPYPGDPKAKEGNNAVGTLRLSRDPGTVIKVGVFTNAAFGG